MKDFLLELLLAILIPFFLLYRLIRVLIGVAGVFLVIMAITSPIWMTVLMFSQVGK